MTFTQGQYTFKRRREKAGKLTFTCNGCQKLNHYLPVVAFREKFDDDSENDEYTLDGDTLPDVSEHLCGNSGIEELVKKFKKDVEDEVCRDPTQPFPTLYLDVRSRYTDKLLGDPKMLFLSEIPTYEVMASSLYRLRRKFIPAAPNTQTELTVDLDWFLLSPEENIVKGDQLHKDGLRVILFASDASLKIAGQGQF